MSRDEARHAGFLNKAMSDFNVSLDLGFLTKPYTFFAPKFIFMQHIYQKNWLLALYYNLSSFRKNPDFRVYPIFRFFESCVKMKTV